VNAADDYVLAHHLLLQRLRLFNPREEIAWLGDDVPAAAKPGGERDGERDGEERGETEGAEVETPEQLMKRGDAAPVDPDTMTPVYDAPQGVIGVGCNEAVASWLARIPGTPESKQPSHVGSHFIGAPAEQRRTASS
jgi:hypothetical protein